LINFRKLIKINRSILAVSQKDHGCVIFCKLKHNEESNDDDDVVHKLCSQNSESAAC